MTLTLLVVEDDRQLRDLLQSYLSEQGYAVHIAETGAGALSQQERQPADLVLLDLGLPDIDGMEVCRRIRESGNRARILVHSAREGEVDKVSALRAGADDYLTKPFGLRERAARVRVALRHANGLANGQAAELESP